jgi:hypothetical protein
MEKMRDGETSGWLSRKRRDGDEQDFHVEGGGEGRRARIKGVRSWQGGRNVAGKGEGEEKEEKEEEEEEEEGRGIKVCMAQRRVHHGRLRKEEPLYSRLAWHMLCCGPNARDWLVLASPSLNTPRQGNDKNPAEDVEPEKARHRVHAPGQRAVAKELRCPRGPDGPENGNGDRPRVDEEEAQDCWVVTEHVRAPLPHILIPVLPSVWSAKGVEEVHCGTDSTGYKRECQSLVDQVPL